MINPVSRSEVWTRTEALAMIEHAERAGPEVFAVMLRVAFETGLRKGELLGLLWSGIDWERRLILVSRSYDRRGTKSGKDRVVPLTAGLAARLREWKAASPFSKEHDPVFPDDCGRVHTENYEWSKRVRATAKAVDAVRPEMHRFGHMTRHFYTSQALLGGASPVQLARWLGHADVSLISKVYAHFGADDDVAAIDRIGISLDAPAEPASVASIAR
jgi:integrase